MLLPIIILWWAQSPMRFATGRYRRNIIGGLLLATAVLWLDCSGRSLSAADPKTVAQGVASAGHELGPVTLQSTAMKYRREGTELDHVDGRILKIGRRWAFIPQSPHRTVDGPHYSVDINGIQDANGDRKADGPNQFWQLERSRRMRVLGGAGKANRVPGSSGIGRGGDDFDDAPLLGSERTEDRRDDHASFTLTENLLLQRIVTAIEEDSLDNVWTVSGTLTEFDEQNFLTLSWARRTNKIAEESDRP